jgi:DNA-binding transcriptional MerR regulator
MQDLSRAAGIPVPTVKYYLREGLLAPGERVGPNQARYGADHVRRLKLVRALLQLGGLSVAEVRDVLGERDAGAEVLARRAVGTPVDDDRRWALAKIEALAQANQWKITGDAPAVTAVVSVLCAVRELCPDGLLDRVDDYATLAEAIAQVDMDAARNSVSTVLGDALLVALRRLAQDSRP